MNDFLLHSLSNCLSTWAKHSLIMEYQKDLLCRYPPNAAGRVPVYIRDIETLEEETFINDQIISKINCGNLYSCDYSRFLSTNNIQPNACF